MTRIKLDDKARVKREDIRSCEGSMDGKKTSDDMYRGKNPHPLFYCTEENPFVPKKETRPNSDRVFISLEERSSPIPVNNVSGGKTVAEAGRSAAMEKLIDDLIDDRLLELNRYVTISHTFKSVTVDRTSLMNDGYALIMSDEALQ